MLKSFSRIASCFEFCGATRSFGEISLFPFKTENLQHNSQTLEEKQ